jgi:YbbR domain-containing protein
LKNRSFLGGIFENWHARILSLAAAVVLFLFHNINTLEERFFSVPVEIVLDAGVMPGSEYPKMVRISLRGEEESIFPILEEDVVAFVDLSEHKSEGIFKAPVQIRKKGTALDVDPLEIRVEPLEVTVAIEEKLFKSVEIIPGITGYPAPGFEIGQFFMTPTTVELEGPKSVVGGITEISTEEIDLSGRREDFSIRVRLHRVNPLIKFPGGDVVEFKCFIDESIIIKTFEQLDIITLNLDPEYIIKGDIPGGLIGVQGNQLTLEAIKPSDMTLLLDCSEISGPGEYTISVRPDIPAGLLIVKYAPVSLDIVVLQPQAEEQAEEE